MSARIQPPQIATPADSEAESLQIRVGRDPLSIESLVAIARGRPGTHAIATPHTWLLAEGWRKAGPLLDPAAAPG